PPPPAASLPSGAASPPAPSPASEASEPPSLGTLQSPLGMHTHPTPGMHMSTVQATLSSQARIVVPGLHAPPLHESPIVQGSPSVQGVVSTLGLPMQSPERHESPVVHTLPSVHSI